MTQAAAATPGPWTAKGLVEVEVAGSSLEEEGGVEANDWDKQGHRCRGGRSRLASRGSMCMLRLREQVVGEFVDGQAKQRGTRTIERGRLNFHFSSI